MKMDAVMKNQVTRRLIAEQAERYPDGTLFRVDIALAPNGSGSAVSTLIPPAAPPTEEPAYHGTRFKAWPQYSMESDQSSYLVLRGF